MLVTADSGRTMATNLGAGVVIDVEAVERAEVVDSRRRLHRGLPARLARDPRRHASGPIELAKQSGGLVALSLSDPFLVERHGEALRELVEAESTCCSPTRRRRGASPGRTTSPGRSTPSSGRADRRGDPRGQGRRAHSTAASGRRVEAWSVGPVDDTTGAGDLFAAGVLHGLVHGAPLEVAGRLGALAAAEIVSHLGAQPRDVAASARP